MNDIEQYIPCKQSVNIGPMTQNEAITLLTSEIIDINQLSQEDMSLLDDLVQDVHLWPLLLSLIRGQLSHNIKQYHLSYHKAIKNVQTKLHHKGLTAFDKNNIESTKRNRKLAVKACIEMTLELLSNVLSDKIKILIMYNGIGTSLQTAVLNKLWNISQQEAEDTVDVLWAYGLIQFADIVITPNNNIQHCVEVHAVISQYIIDNMDYRDFLSICITSNTLKSVAEGLTITFQQSHGINDLSSLTKSEYLKYKITEIENVPLLYYLNLINRSTINDPHFVILIIQLIKNSLMNSPNSRNLLSLLGEEINSIISECKQILKDSHKLSRILNQCVQRNLHYKNYDNLIQTVEEFIKDYPTFNVAQKAVAVMKKIMPYCDGELLHNATLRCEHLQMRTHNYHSITTLALPTIKLYVNLHKQITGALMNGSPDIELIYHYIKSGNVEEEFELVKTNQLIKLQEVAPNYVHNQVSQQ